MGLLASLGAEIELFSWTSRILHLHPPQAYSIARIVAREKPTSQLFFSTHSSRFIQGLADSAADRLLVVRLDGTGGRYTADRVDVYVFSEIKSSPILKFNSVIDSVFFQRTFVCEEASHCLFYKTSFERLGFSTDQTFWIGVSRPLKKSPMYPVRLGLPDLSPFHMSPVNKAVFQQPVSGSPTLQRPLPHSRVLCVSPITICDFDGFGTTMENTVETFFRS